MLWINNVSKVFKKKNSSITAVNRANLEVGKGEIVCILGHNGAGKTTLIKCISGLITPSQGDITINSKSVIKHPEIPKSSVGAVLEGSRNIYYYLSAKENLKYFGLLNNLSIDEISKRTEYYLELFDLKGRENEMVKQFSRGMQQKVAIMVALMKEPDILLLDEPTLGLDIISSNIVKEVIKNLATKSNKTIIITTHDINLIEGLNSRLVFMKKGEIIKDDTLRNLRNIIETDNKYEVTMQVDSDEPVNDCDEYTVIEKSENIVTLATKNLNWLAQSITSNKIIGIKRAEANFEDIYTRIIGDGIKNE